MVTETQEAVARAENEALVKQMLQEAEEPGGKTGVVHHGDEKQPSPMIFNVASADYITLWRTDTFEAVPVNRNMLAQCLKKKREDGQPAFTTTRPTQEPFRGTIKCLLHPSQPNHAEVLALGFKPCRKSNLPSPMQLQLHMEHRHRMEWKTLEASRIEREKREERAFQRQLMTAVKHPGGRPAKAK